MSLYESSDWATALEAEAVTKAKARTKRIEVVRMVTKWPFVCSGLAWNLPERSTRSFSW